MHCVDGPDITHATAQTYTDKVYLQDCAEKFDWQEAFDKGVLLSLESDRNHVISVLSSTGLLHPWEKKLVP